jgi:hypothetical protein
MSQPFREPLALTNASLDRAVAEAWAEHKGRCGVESAQLDADCVCVDWPSCSVSVHFTIRAVFGDRIYAVTWVDRLDDLVADAQWPGRLNTTIRKECERFARENHERSHRQDHP